MCDAKREEICRAQSLPHKGNEKDFQGGLCNPKGAGQSYWEKYLDIERW
jgi:hypothetical protein